jgi:hypothetical protein
MAGDDSQDGRDETENERMDRNWNELLQELRVTQTGTQVLSGFLLTLAFQPRFASLDSFEHGLYVGLVLLAGMTIVAGLAPVNLHRSVFRRGMKASVVGFGHHALRAQLVGVALIVVGTVLFVLDVAAGRTAGVIGAAVLLVLIVLAATVPHLVRPERATSAPETVGAGRRPTGKP